MFLLHLKILRRATGGEDCFSGIAVHRRLNAYEPRIEGLARFVHRSDKPPARHVTPVVLLSS
jgi:hypothetical protein